MAKEITITKIAIFQKKEVRKTLHKDEWQFSVIDVIEVLTGTDRPRKYWNDLKKKLEKEGYSELSEKIGQLKMTSTDGKKLEAIYRQKLADLEELKKSVLKKAFSGEL